ncbi:hypothetical protein LCGC14_1789280, partial [marine sediment metagenome]
MTVEGLMAKHPDVIVKLQIPAETC